MAFKATKFNIDLTLDLTEYIPEEKGGILKSDKNDGDSIQEWNNFAIQEGMAIEKYRKIINDKNNNDNPEKAEMMIEAVRQSRLSVIKQIDFFYGKGIDFYKSLLLPTLKEILEYLRKEVDPVKKKSQKSMK